MPSKPDLPPTSAPSTDRARAFRDRLERTSLMRWEIFVSEATKRRVRQIAAEEGLTTGVAAEALLELGIEAYLDGVSGPTAPRRDPTPVEVRPRFGAAPAASSVSRPLVSYSSRPGGAAGEAAPAPKTDASVALRGFFDRAISKKK